MKDIIRDAPSFGESASRFVNEQSGTILNSAAFTFRRVPGIICRGQKPEKLCIEIDRGEWIIHTWRSKKAVPAAAPRHFQACRQGLTRIQGQFDPLLIHCNIRNWALNQKLHIGNQTCIRSCASETATHQKLCIRSRRASETAHQQSVRIRQKRVSETGVWKLARGYGGGGSWGWAC